MCCCNLTVLEQTIAPIVCSRTDKLQLLTCVVAARCVVEVLSWSGGGNKKDCGSVRLLSTTLGKPGCKQAGGLYIIKINALTCSMVDTVIYSQNNVGNLRNALILQPRFTVLVGVTIDDAMLFLTNPAVDALKNVIGVDIRDVQYRGSFVFVVQTGTSNKLVKKVITSKESQKQPAFLRAKITGM